VSLLFLELDNDLTGVTFGRAVRAEIQPLRACSRSDPQLDDNDAKAKCSKMSELQQIRKTQPKDVKRMRNKQERDMKGMKEKLGSGTVERRDRAACMQALHWCYVSTSLVGKDVPPGGKQPRSTF
jgi:hypothetical protein